LNIWYRARSETYLHGRYRCMLVHELMPSGLYTQDHSQPEISFLHRSIYQGLCMYNYSLSVKKEEEEEQKKKKKKEEEEEEVVMLAAAVVVVVMAMKKKKKKKKKEEEEGTYTYINTHTHTTDSYC